MCTLTIARSVTARLSSSRHLSIIQPAPALSHFCSGPTRTNPGGRRPAGRGSGRAACVTLGATRTAICGAAHRQASVGGSLPCGAGRLCSYMLLSRSISSPSPSSSSSHLLSAELPRRKEEGSLGMEFVLVLCYSTTFVDRVEQV